MNPTSPKIIFFGTEAYSLVSLKSLVERGYNVVAVVTKPDMRSGRGQKIVQPAVKVYAKKHNIAVWQPTKLVDLIPQIQALTPVTGVLVAYGKIIPQKIIDLFTPGIINLHPSLLPLWRGPSPIEAAIANQDQQTGVSIMQLEAGMDSGPVYTQSHRELRGTETKPQLYQELFHEGSELLTTILPAIISGSLQPTAQDETRATYCHLLSKDISYITPENMSAKQADAHIRAYLGFPRSRILNEGRELIITKAHVAPEQQTPLDVKFQDANWLIIDELIAPSGKTMTTRAYLRGYPIS